MPLRPLSSHHQLAIFSVICDKYGSKVCSTLRVSLILISHFLENLVKTNLLREQYLHQKYKTEVKLAFVLRKRNV